MSTSLDILSPDSSDGHPSESRFTQAAPSNRANAKSMSIPFKFLAQNFTFGLNARTSPPITFSLPREEFFPRFVDASVSNESLDLCRSPGEAQPTDWARIGTMRNFAKGVTLGARPTSQATAEFSFMANTANACSPDSVYIRPAFPDDVEPLVRLINAAFRVEQPYIDGDRVDAHSVRSYLAKGKFLVAEDSTGLAACVYV